MNKSILIQDRLRPALRKVIGCKDYREQEQLLTRVDRILRLSGVERLFVELSLARYQAKAKGPVPMSALVRHSESSERALRCTVLKNIIDEDYRGMSMRLAQCELFRWFCKLPELEHLKVPGKSILQGYAHWLPHEEMTKVLSLLREAMADEDRAREIGLEAELEMEVAWVDSTCLKANIHFPVDRGFDSAASRRMLQEQNAFNGLCPRNSHDLKRRMREDEAFVGAQKRRAQTEGRIGILKNVFLQGVPRAKGFENRQLQVDWAVFSHNLWVLARQPWIEMEEPVPLAA